MPGPDLYQLFTAPLEEVGIRYMVTGAVASIVYGEPRLTHDIDIVLEIVEEGEEKIAQAFPADQFYCPPIEVIRLEAKRPLRGHFNVIHHATGFKADFYPMGRDELHGYAMERRKRVETEGRAVWLAPPEYVILRKLEYYREGRSEKHLRDIAGMLELSGAQIDMTELQERIKCYGIEKEWSEVQKLQ